MAVRATAALLAVLLLSSCTRSSPPSPRPASEAEAVRDTRAGAAQAAAEHVRLLNSATMYDRSARQKALTSALHPDAEDQMAGLHEGYDRVASVLELDAAGRPASGSLVARAAVLGAEVVRFDPPRAQVEVWSVGLLGVAAPASTQPVQERWSTEVVDVVWDGERWRYAGLRHEEGPVPVGGAQLPSPTDALGDAPAPLGEA